MNYKILNRPWGRECIFSANGVNATFLLPDIVTDPTELIFVEVARIKAMDGKKADTVDSQLEEML